MPGAPAPVRPELAPVDSTAGAVVPASAPGSAVPAVSAEIVTEESLIPMDSYVEEILKAFNNGSTPVDAARSVYDAMETRKLLPLLRMNIERGDWAGLLKNPRIASNPELLKWVSSFRESLKSEMLEPVPVGAEEPDDDNDDE